jgi:predicted RNA-binding protein (virulence factor B family)
MEKDKRYVVYLYEDEKTNRLVASSKINQFLEQETIDLEKNQEVDVMVSHITDVGINVIINGKYRGLAYKNEVFETVSPGYKTKAYIKLVRPDGKIDVSFQKLGVEVIDASAQSVLQALQQNNGFLALNDDSHPEEIKSVLKMSKKSFKKAIGSLYKQKLISIKENGIQLN